MIYNVLGAVIYSEHLQAGQHAIDLKEKAKGVYLMKVLVDEKQETHRLIIEGGAL